MTSLKFGYWESEFDIKQDDFEISTLPEIEEARYIVKRDMKCLSHFCFPHYFGTSSFPLMSGNRFELPMTHLFTTRISLGNENEERELIKFLILTIGFLCGMRFTPDGEGHLFPTPLKKGNLVSFIASDPEILSCIDTAKSTWIRASAENRKLLFSSIHWFLTSQSYKHQFEIFSWQYIVTDSLSAFFCSKDGTTKRTSHSVRPQYLSKHLNTPLPSSFLKGGTGNGVQSRLAEIRNCLIHEGLWLGQPIGYQSTHEGHELVEQLKFFNSQIILGALGIECHFRRATFCWQIHGLDVEEKLSL